MSDQIFDFLIRCASGKSGDWSRLAPEDLIQAGEAGNKLVAELADYEAAIDYKSLVLASAALTTISLCPIGDSPIEVKAHNDVVDVLRRFEVLRISLAPESETVFKHIVEVMTEPPGRELED